MTWIEFTINTVRKIWKCFNICNQGKLREYFSENGNYAKKKDFCMINMWKLAKKRYILNGNQNMLKHSIPNRSLSFTHILGGGCTVV